MAVLTLQERLRAWGTSLDLEAAAVIDSLTAQNEAWQRNSRETFDAMVAMRNGINEHLPMPSLESDLLQGPENSVFCAAVAEAVVSEVFRLRDRLARLEGAAARDVLAERARQVEAEGWTPEHDDAHQNREMAVAAGCYAIFAAGTEDGRAATDLPGRYTVDGKPIKAFFAWQNVWPWDRSWWKPTSPRRDLVKAGALILAEIERLDRTALTAGGTGA